MAEKSTVQRCLRACAVLAAALLLGAAPADAAHTVTAFSLTTANTQAGASVNASSSTSLSYSNATDDVKKTIGHFAPGMIANPEAVPHCPQARFVADTCPADTRIGEAQAVVDTFPPTVPILEPGRIYNQELLGSEAGRLGIIVDSATGKLFLTAPFYVRSDGDYGLDGVLDDIPRLTPATQVTRLSFTLYGTVNGRNYTRAPTSCTLHVSRGEAFAYDHPEAVGGPTSSYTPTGCDRLPFKPRMEISVGGRGATKFNSKPPLSVHVSQGPGEAGILANGVTLPAALTPNVAAFQSICNQAQLAANACPPGSRIGTTTATSAFVATPLSGPVYLVQQPGRVLPGLVADLQGRVRVRISIETSILNGKQIASSVTNVPDLPVSTFTLALNGGERGPLLNKADLCYRSASRRRHRRLSADISFTGQNGAKVAGKPRIGVQGCAPAVRATARRLRSGRPSLLMRVARHPDAQKLQALELKLPKGFRLSRRKVARRGAVLTAAKRSGKALRVLSRRRLAVRLPGRASVVTVKLGRGSLRAKRSVRRKRRLRLVVRTVDATGKRARLGAVARVRR
jgi:hypothetical protein